jgi:hypothetical protein
MRNVTTKASIQITHFLLNHAEQGSCATATMQSRTFAARALKQRIGRHRLVATAVAEEPVSSGLADHHLEIATLDAIGATDLSLRSFLQSSTNVPRGPSAKDSNLP